MTDRTQAHPSTARVVSAATTATVLAVVPVFILGAFVVLIREDIAISDEQLGFVVSAFFLASMISAVPGGRLADAVGPRRGMAVAAVPSIVAMVGMAVAASTWWHVGLLMLVGGVGSGMGMPASNLRVAQGVTAQRRGLAFGIKQAAAPIASVVAGFAVPLLGLTVGWRPTFIGTALVLPVMLVLLDRDTAPTQRVPEGRPGGHRAPAVALVLLATTSGFAAASATTAIGFFVESAVARGFATSTAGYALGVASTFGIAARIMWGWLADRRERGHLSFLSWLFVVGGVGFGLLGVVETVPMLGLAAIVVLAAGWSWSGLVFLVATLGSPGAPATATGITSAGGGLGGLLGPIIFGSVVEASSYTTAWALTAAWMLAAAVLARVTLRVWLRQLEKRSTTEQRARA